MTTLYTKGAFVHLTPAEFASYTSIRDAVGDVTTPVGLGFTASGTVDFSMKLGMLAAHIEGWTGADEIISGGGADTLWGNAGNDSLYGAAGDDLLFGDWDLGAGNGDDQLFGGDGNDVLFGGTGNDYLYGGNGDDEFQIGEERPGNDLFFGGTGTDQASIRDSFASGLTTFALQRLTLNAAASVEFLVVDADLTGTSGNDAIDLTGTTAYRDDFFAITQFEIDLLGGSDSFLGGVSNESVTLSGGNDHADMGAGNDTLSLGDAIRTGDVLYGGSGLDRLILGNFDFNYVDTGTKPAAVYALTSFDFVSAGLFEEFFVGADIQLTGSAGADVISTVSIADIRLTRPLLLLEGNDRYTAGSSGISVDAGTGNDTLTGGTGADTLIGGAGNDLMTGGDGGDTYQIDSSGDVVVETGTYGIDTLIVTARTWTLVAQFEGLTAQGPGGLIGIGNASDNFLTGGAGDDSLSGLAGKDRMTGAGHDTLLGGNGDDLYYVSDSRVTIVELARQGSDTIVTDAATWTLTGEVENLTLFGSGDALGIGSARANVMRVDGTGHETVQGMGGNDMLIGFSAGARLEGGNGNDVYNVGYLGGQIVELARGGIDRVDMYFGIGDGGPLPFPAITSYVLPDFVEQLYLHPQYVPGSPDKDGPATGIGNASDNLIVGSNGSDTLYGMDGNDTLLGVSDEFGASANDGNDSLIGGNGDDTYRLRFFHNVFGGDVSDTVVEALDGGFDTIELSVAFATLNDYANIDAVNNGYFSGSGVHKVGSNTVGNTLNNLLITNIGDDFLYGGGGHDTLTGGAGSDRFGMGTSLGETFTTESADTITDFSHGADKMVLDYWDFSALGNVRVADAAFKVIGGGGVVDASDRLLYNQATGQLFYDRDGNGAAAAWLLAEFSNHTVLSATDFVMTL